MKALLLSSPGTLAIADVEKPAPAVGEVLVRISRDA
jgi:NADPH:quinone reductase-like Zn-dependent oxidoreductase